MIPIIKSEQARQQMRMFEGEWRSGVFQITRITTMFQVVATTENTELSTQQTMSEAKKLPTRDGSKVARK